MVFIGVILALLVLSTWLHVKTRRLDRERRAHQARFALAVSGTNDGIWDWDLETNKTYFSPRYYTMLGYDPDEFPPSYESWRQLLHPDDVEASEKDIQRAVEEHIPVYDTCCEVFP